jgi:hypothetical protein
LLETTLLLAAIAHEWMPRGVLKQNKKGEPQFAFLFYRDLTISSAVPERR